MYEDEKDICSMLFESVLFEDTHIGKTPLAYFIDNAPLSSQEKHLYQAWRIHTRYEFFLIEKVIPEQEIHLTDLLGKTHYKIYETSGTLTLTEGKVIIARLVPFLDGWMITTEKVISFSNVSDEWK